MLRGAIRTVLIMSALGWSARSSGGPVLAQSACPPALGSLPHPGTVCWSPDRAAQAEHGFMFAVVAPRALVQRHAHLPLVTAVLSHLGISANTAYTAPAAPPCRARASGRRAASACRG